MAELQTARLTELLAKVKALNENVRFAPAEGGYEMDEISKSCYGRFFRDHGKELEAALTASERPGILTLRDAAQTVFDTFSRDEAQGFRSKDRQFAIEILGAALTPREHRPLLTD